MTTAPPLSKLNEALFRATQSADADEVQRQLAQGAQVDCRDDDGITPLIWAAVYHSADCVRLLLEAGADPNGLTRTGQPALIQTSNVATARCLLDAGADVNLSDRWPILRRTVKRQSIELLELYLEAGAEVDARDPLGWTALMLAAKRGELKALECLMRAGAALEAVNHLGETALFLAAEDGQTATIEALLAAGANIEARGPGGLTPVMIAAHHGHKTATKTLLARGASSTAVNDAGNTVADLRQQATERRKILTQVRKLLASRDIDVVNQGLALLEEADDPLLWMVFGAGLSISTSGAFQMERSSEVVKRVKSTHRQAVALWVLNRTGALDNVTKLSLSGCKNLKHVDGLQGCTKLVELNLSSCTALENVDGLRGCSSLQTLQLVNCHALTSLVGLTDCSALRELHVNSGTALPSDWRGNFSTRAEVAAVVERYLSVWSRPYDELLPEAALTPLRPTEVDALATFTHRDPLIQALQRARHTAIQTQDASAYLDLLKSSLELDALHPQVAEFIRATMHIKQMKTLTGLNGLAARAPYGLRKSSEVLPAGRETTAYFPAIWLDSDTFIDLETAAVISLHHDGTFLETLHGLLERHRLPSTNRDWLQGLASQGGVMELKQLVIFEMQCFGRCRAWPQIAPTEQEQVFDELCAVKQRSPTEIRRRFRQMLHYPGYELLYTPIQDYVDRLEI